MSVIGTYLNRNKIINTMKIGEKEKLRSRNMKPTISVIVLAYNAGDYIKNTMLRILARRNAIITFLLL